MCAACSWRCRAAHAVPAMPPHPDESPEGADVIARWLLVNFT